MKTFLFLVQQKCIKFYNFSKKNIKLHFISILVYFSLFFIFLYLAVYGTLFFKSVFLIFIIIVFIKLLIFFFQQSLSKRNKVKFRQFNKKVELFFIIVSNIFFYLTAIVIFFYLLLYISWIHGLLFFIIFSLLILGFFEKETDRKTFVYSIVFSIPICHVIWVIYFGK
jgi:hypothetical protein